MAEMKNSIDVAVSEEELGEIINSVVVAASEEGSGDYKTDTTLNFEKLKNRMDDDLLRCLTSKMELFFRDDLTTLSNGEGESKAYQEWMNSSRNSHLLIFNMVDLLEGKSAEQFEQFSAYMTNNDLCLVLYKSQKISPQKFYAEFARWLAIDWAQVRIESRDYEGYTHQKDPPAVHVKIANVARKLIAHEEESLSLQEMLFVVRVFQEMWCRPMEHELYWRSMCGCLYNRDNVNPHRHTCSNCGKFEQEKGQLKGCGRCKNSDYGKYFKRYYCDVECQKEHWVNVHKGYHQNLENLMNRDV